MSAVDIVVPCYNYARYLKDCVDSVLSQRDVDVRVLIIDDKSSDKTPEVGQQLAASDPRVTFRRHEINKGLIGTANEGFEWVEAPYWLLLSADDALTPGSLARATSVLDAHPEVGMVYGTARIILDDDCPPIMDDEQLLTAEIISGRDFLEHVFCRGNTVPSPSAVVRTNLQRSLGGYRAEFPHTSDLELWSRIAVHSKIAAIHELQAYYRQHRASMTHQYINGAVADACERLSTYDFVTRSWAKAIPDLEKFMRATRVENSRYMLGRACEAYERRDTDKYKACMMFVTSNYQGYKYTRDYYRLLLLKVLGSRITNAIRGLKANIFRAPAEQEQPVAFAADWGSWPINSEPHRR